MKDINELCGDNLGGLICFEFIPKDDVQSVPEVVDGKILKPVVLKAKKYWFKGYGTLGTMGFSEDQDNGDHGAQYNPKMSAVIPKEMAENSALYYEMRHVEFLVKYTNANGLKKLVGTIEEPLKFMASLNTGDDIPKRNQHAISFYGKTTKPAAVYDV